ncbi:DUF1302 family protein [Panacagrimonas sp.]|uniref:DUF1302 family protein n=1 Tax=Panacagrimonas sp. TaxID=2480088 RepID=UPI003B523F65
MNRVEGKSLRLSALAIAAMAAFATPSAMAQDGGGFFSDLGVQFGGFVRFDSAYRTTNLENMNNLRGNPFNGVATARRGGLPLRDQLQIIDPLNPLIGTITGLLDALGANEVGLLPDMAARNTPPADNDWNLNQFRGKFDMQLQFSSNLQLYASLRTIYDMGNYDNWNPNSVPGADPMGFNSQEPEFFEYDDFESGGCLNPLEVCGEKYMADFTSLYLDYQSGPVLVRVGQQQIAWGQALFFRVFDVPNGLDLRRHLILDDALEEYADERVASPGVRVTWQATQEWELDAYGQWFVPTTFPNANTPYNVIPAQFSIRESWSDRFDDKINYGLRLRGNFGNWGLQFIATQRYNHEGTFRWTESGSTQDVPGLPGSGNAVQNTPLEVDPSGVWSAAEWFTYAGAVRLDGVEALNTLIREFRGDQPAGLFLGEGAGAGALLASEVTNIGQAANELDLFFQLAGGKLLNPLGTGGGLRGHLIHEYHQEEVYGAGVSYVVEAEPGSLLDQLIINLETSYIPDRVFTEKSLSRNFTVEDESVTALVMEKYQRFSGTFPATYMVFQAIHKTESDLFGRHLSCQGGTGDNPGTTLANIRSGNSQCQPLDGGFTSLVLAFLQPFPNYIYRASGAMLYDPRGGLLVQGGFRWSPGNDITLDLIYNHLEGDLHGNKNENIIETIDFADEVAVRLAYQF